MLICRNCGYEGIFESSLCPRCHFPRPRDNEEILKLRLSADEALKAKDYTVGITLLRELVSLEDAYGERELARLYEKGEELTADIDLAMEYYKKAAMHLDGEGAFRYSRLVSRMSGTLADFFLRLSAELGYTGAYLDTAEAYRERGEEELYLYYLTLAEECGVADARVALAQWYTENLEGELGEGYARWYLDRFTFPPFNAIKLSYKLRSAKKLAPPEIMCDKEKLLSSLLNDAAGLELHPITAYLAERLIPLGNTDAVFTLSEMYIAGLGVEKNIDKAMALLSRSAEGGVAEASLALGIFYKQGELVPKNLDLAIAHLNRAVSDGRADAYMHIADILHDKTYHKRDIARAYELYLLAAEAGAEGAYEKALRIARVRDDYFTKALALERESKITAELYKFYGISAVMGHPEATLKLAECYALGRGTRKNRREAFVWYKKALLRGVREANLPLGVCYSRGFGTAFCYERAIEHLSAATSIGDSRAERELSRLMARRLRGVSNKIYSEAARLIYLKKYTLAKATLDRAYAMHHPRATYLLGCLYEFGRGTATNKTRAFELYTEAAALGFTDERAKYKSVILRLVKRI